MINGKVFDWEDIKISAPWGIDIEILAINYKSTRTAVAAYGRGNAPRGYGRQNLEQDGSVEMDARSFLKLSAYAATQGGILRIKPFVITASFANDDQISQTDILDGVVFEEISAEATQGDEEVGKKTLNIKIFNPIKYNAIPCM